ncbi:hypothetical protein GCM10022396_32350 [Flavivirga amylovorans]
MLKARLFLNVKTSFLGRTHVSIGYDSENKILEIELKKTGKSDNTITFQKVNGKNLRI